MRLSLPTLLAALLLTMPMLASAQVYKWTDANGTTHFSQTRPPKGVKYTSVNTPAQAEQPVEGEVAKKAADKSKDGNTKADKARSAQLKQFCARLKANISLLTSDKALKQVSNSGKTTLMSKKMRTQQLEQQQMRYNGYCK